jgi:predicted nucleic acid-binding protein
MADAYFDTTVFIDYFRGHTGAEYLVLQTLMDRRPLYSPVSVFELWLRPMSRQEEARHLALLRLCEEAQFDSQAAVMMASWLRIQPRSGRRRMLGDAIIAASAAIRGATIYTRNVRDLARFYPNVQSY